mmetsp:Transcript_15026/g.49477  ORF Transcript_15026/g.49477 Transcript_15026/m.49477 type:complete len:211 (+) Transcript_15026:791-1423(+)
MPPSLLSLYSTLNATALHLMPPASALYLCHRTLYSANHCASTFSAISSTTGTAFALLFTRFSAPSTIFMLTILSPAFTSRRSSWPSMTYPNTAYRPSRMFVPDGVSSLSFKRKKNCDDALLGSLSRRAMAIVPNALNGNTGSSRYLPTSSNVNSYTGTPSLSFLTGWISSGIVRSFLVVGSMNPSAPPLPTPGFPVCTTNPSDLCMSMPS